MEPALSFWLLPAAFALDLLIGDPRSLPHPVRWMGRAIEAAEPLFRRMTRSAVLAGLLFTAVLVTAAWSLTTGLLSVAGSLHAGGRTVLEIILIGYCLSARSLADAATTVLKTLKNNGLSAARAELSMIVGRDVAGLDAPGVRRALVETVAENLVDGVLSPLFYAAIGGAPLAIAYKMVNTLDSMVGYRNEAYADFGKASARLDDAANYIPARLSVPVIALAAHLLGAPAKRSLAAALREGRCHASPNAGFPEAAFAGALGARLNGPSTYGGRLVQKPWLGAGFLDPGPQHVRRACDLMWLSSLLWLAMAMLLQAVMAAWMWF